MRLRKLVVALAGLSLSGGAFALTPMAVNGFLSNPNACTNWIIGGAATYMEPLGNNLDYATTVNETSAVNTSFPQQHDHFFGLGDGGDHGDVTNIGASNNVVTDEQDVNPDFGWGGMGLIDYRFPQTTNDVELSYLHFNDSNDDTTTASGTGQSTDFLVYGNNHHDANDGNNDPIGESVTANYSGINPRGNTLTVGDVTTLAQHLEVYHGGGNTSVSEEPGLVGVSSGSPLLFNNVEGDIDSSYDGVNLEFGHTFNDGRLGIRVHGGAQYARMEEQETVDASNPVFVQAFTGQNENQQGPDEFDVHPYGETGNITENNVSDSQFNGIGPRVGIGATFDCGSGVSLYADTGVDLLVGDTDTTATSVAQGQTSQTQEHDDNDKVFDTTNTTINQSAIYTSGNSTTVIPGGDAEAGISYTAAVGNNVNLTGQIGYMVVGYVDPINHVFATDTQDNWTDFGLQGAYAGLDLSF